MDIDFLHLEEALIVVGVQLLVRYVLTDFRYIIDVCLQTYSWEGQFEDVDASSRYQNLTHFAANHTIRYIARNLSNDPEMVSEAVELMRFVEDQFVVWGKFPERSNMPKFERYYTPCGMEQYYCYWPIDSSTATVLNTFVEMYRLKNDRLYLEKALALADTITRVQVEETGMIPTFWMGENCWEGHRNFWINCQIHSAFSLMQLAELTVTEPFTQTYPVTGYLRSKSLDLEADFAYVESCRDANLVGVKDKIVMVNGRVGYAAYEKLKKAGVAGFISFDGSLLDEPGKYDIDIRKLRPMLTDELGDSTAVHMHVSDAIDLVRRGATRVHMKVQATDAHRVSQNVICTIPGTDRADEIISFGAHYDSVFFSTGVYDNGAGSVILLELVRHFVQNPPRRTLRFVWYGSEEQGLFGSKHDVVAHAKELEDCRMMINVDVAGPVLGQEFCEVTGEKCIVSCPLHK